METLRYIRKIRNTRLLFSNVPVFDQKAFIQFQPVSNGPTNGSINGYPSKEAVLINIKKAKHSVVQKPPPIFVYTADDSNKFNRFSSILQQILLSDTNTIAQISLISLFKQPWIDEKPACLIILNVIPFDEFVSYLLHSYLEKNGKVIFAYQNDPNSQESLSLWKEAFRKSLYKENVIFLDYNIENLLEENGILKKAFVNLGIELAKEHRSIEFSKGYLIAAQDRILWNMQGLRYGDYIGEKPILFLQPSIVLANNPHVLPKADENLLPIEVCRRNKAVIPNGNFDIEEYFGILKTPSLGKVLLYVPVCESTMEVAKSLTTMVNDMSGIVVVAGHQTKSRGRSGNQWLSVPGSALFTFNFQLSINSNLGKFLGYIQHIVAAAIVDTINTLADQETGAKIKWPNDIYFKRESKIGGILVQSSCKNDVFQCLIGMGLNVDNPKPTICINDILPDYCEKLTIEAVIAEFMNKFEEYVQLFEEKGRFEFLHKYYQHWLHSQEEVTVDMDGDPEQAIIQGLDEHGYLEVRSKKNGIISHVTDNGNSFDMMKGLIRAKFS